MGEGSWLERIKKWFRKKQIKFSKVVYIKRPFPTLAFVTKELKECYVVFIPISPSPATGFTFIISKDDVKETNITPSEAFEFFVSFGLVVPKEFEEMLKD